MEKRYNGLNLPRNINYLKYGDSLECLQFIKEIEAKGRIRKENIWDYTDGNRPINNCTKQIVEGFGGLTRSTICIPSLKSGLDKTVVAEKSFRELDCKGFSYSFSTRPSGFCVPLRKKINVRTALFADTTMHYPASIRKFLGKTSRSHYYDYNGPAIAFLLGTFIGGNIYILTLQSDLVHNVPSAVRDHIRGWRRILFNLTISHYKPNKIFLIRSEDVLRSCHAKSNVPSSVPQSWRNIYEQTAYEYNAELIELKRGVNIQLYHRHSKVIGNRFFEIIKE